MRVMAQPKGSVTDFEALFSQSETEELDSLIQDFEKRTTIQIAIVTLNEYYCDKEDFEAYTLLLANTWGIGQKGKDNGVLIAISKQYRQMRIHNGNGIEKILSDEATKQIIDHHFIPKFKENNYFEGTKNGLLALMQTLENKQALQTKSEAFTTELIALIEQKDNTAIAQHIAEKLYCGMCYPSAKSPNGISKELFLKKYIREVFSPELLQRLQRKETQFLANSTDYGDCVIRYTTHRQNENGDGHEGVQFCFWLTEENGKLKLSGLEILP
ncbi:TPM domain-containing protein [Epilithonimonas xixisoli]|nr:TPM domain-containing protein [Epilithonimonas xixisoli]